MTEDAEHLTYDPQYSSAFDIRNDGIHFSWRVRAQFPDECDGDRQASVSGRITLRLLPAPSNAVEATWVEGPSEHFSSFSPGFLDVISLDYCLIVGDVGVGGTLARRLGEMAREWVAEVVRSQIVEPLGLDLPSGGGRIRLRDATLETLPGEVRVTIYPDDGLLAAAGLRLDRVAVDLPYHGLGSGSPVDRGFVLKSGDNVYMMASGQAGPCTSDRFLPWPQCVRLAAIGPAGVINRESNPLIDGSLPGGGPVVGQRAEALDGMTSLQRTPAELTFPERNAGGIVAHLVPSGGSQRRWIGAGPTGLQVDTPRAWLSFGVNDRFSPTITPYAWGSGTFQLTVFWLD